MKKLRLVDVVCLSMAALALGAALPGCESEEMPGPEVAGEPDRPTYANELCPIMKEPIPPGPVPHSLTRVYKGQTVVFCCPGCPTTWDNLSEQEKEAKLAAVAARPAGEGATEPGESSP